MSEEGKKEIPRAIWEGTFTVFGVRLRCSVLDDEAHTRVINAEDLAKLFKEMEACSVDDLFDVDDLVEFNKWQQGF